MAASVVVLDADRVIRLRSDVARDGGRLEVPGLERAWDGVEALARELLWPLAIDIDTHFIDTTGQAHPTRRPERWQWAARSLRVPPDLDFSDRSIDLVVDDDELDRDALLSLAAQAFALREPLPEGTTLGWTMLRVDWVRVLLASTTTVDRDGDGREAVWVDVGPGPGDRLVPVPVERWNNLATVTGPKLYNRVPAPLIVGATPVDRSADLMTVELSIGIRWSSFWDSGAPSRHDVDRAVNDLVDAGWRVVDEEDAVRLGAISVDRPPPSFPEGITFSDRYVIDSVVFRWGRGWLCLGRDKHDERYVFITVRPLGGATPDGVRARLGFEAPGLAPLLEVATIEARGGARHLAVVEAHPGTQAAANALQPPLPLEDVASVGAALAGVLAAAHAHHVVLQEVRPELIFVETDQHGRRSLESVLPRAAPLLMGGALDSEEDVFLPFDHIYLAPELVAGETSGPASDVFSLCALLVHWLTGAHPFNGQRFVEQAMAINAHQRRPLPAGISVPIILERGLSPDPATRPSAVDLEVGLRALP